MSRKRYIASDPTAWKAISWADRETKKKKIPAYGHNRKRQQKETEEEEKTCEGKF